MTRRAKAALAAALLTATLASAGCGMTVGKPDASGHSSTVSGHKKSSAKESRLPHHGAPKVPDPVDISRFKQHPCSALTQAQLDTLGVKGQGRADTDTAAGDSCAWGSGAHQVHVGYNIFSNNPGGLSDLYAINKSQPDKYAMFKPSQPINGFPSVRLHVDANEQENGVCSYFVGINDRSAIQTNVQEDPGGDPCDDAKQVALSITKTMKDGSR